MSAVYSVPTVMEGYALVPCLGVLTADTAQVLAAIV
jgi:hypothetical protein